MPDTGESLSEEDELIEELKKLPGNQPKEGPKETALHHLLGSEVHEFKKVYLDLAKREADLELASQKLEEMKMQVEEGNSELKQRCQELQEALSTKEGKLSLLQEQTKKAEQKFASKVAEFQDKVKKAEAELRARPVKETVRYETRYVKSNRLAFLGWLHESGTFTILVLAAGMVVGGILGFLVAVLGNL